MIMSVSTFMISSGAATPVRDVNCSRLTLLVLSFITEILAQAIHGSNLPAAPRSVRRRAGSINSLLLDPGRGKVLKSPGKDRCKNKEKQEWPWSRLKLGGAAPCGRAGSSR